MATASKETTSTRWLRPFLAAMVAALAAILLGTTASASAAVGAETRVGAFNVAGEVLVGPPEYITAGQRLGEAAPQPVFVVATGVAANSERLLAKADRIEAHLARPEIGYAAKNDAMLARIRSAGAEGTPLSRADRAFMRHELTENWLMNRGMGIDLAHRIAGWTHRTYGNFDPSVIKQLPQEFNSNWRRFWDIE